MNATQPSGSDRFAAHQDPELLQALLSAAREEREDEHRQLMDAQAFINSIIDHPLYRSARRGVRLVRKGRSKSGKPEAASTASGDTAAPKVDPAMEHALTSPGADSILVDCGPLDESMRSGISRVTIRLFQELWSATGGRAELVRAVGGVLRRDLTYEAALLAGMSPRGEALGEPITGLISVRVTPQAELASWRSAVVQYRAGGGGRYLHMVHDLLPITVPEFFDRNLRGYFPDWLTAVLDEADTVLTNSQATTDDLLAWGQLHGRPPGRMPPVCVVPMGADLAENAPSGASGDGEEGGSAKPDEPAAGDPVGRPVQRVLVVGTVEPRKGVEAVVDAAEVLSERGADVDIVLVGARGWIGAHTLARLEAADAADVPLRWVRDVDDAALQRHYAQADLLLAPSRAEGYGLPVVEALAHGVPVLARDIPVFREICGDAIAYFPSDAALPDAILAALADPRAAPPPPHSWTDTARTVITELQR